MIYKKKMYQKYGYNYLYETNCKYLQNDDVDEYTAAEEESEIGDDDEMYDSNMEDEENGSEFVFSEGEEEEMEDIEVIRKK